MVLLRHCHVNPEFICSGIKAIMFLYVGKAKNLRKRVSSYFLNKHFENNKLRILVKQIDRIDHIVVDTESDALLLENNLIKEYQPRYNVLLKDDKTFPFICIRNEDFQGYFLPGILSGTDLYILVPIHQLIWSGRFWI
jgi:hypothetical protein